MLPAIAYEPVEHSTGAVLFGQLKSQEKHSKIESNEGRMLLYNYSITDLCITTTINMTTKNSILKVSFTFYPGVWVSTTIAIKVWRDIFTNKNI